VLSDPELTAIWHAAAAMPLPFGAIIKLLMLTGQRVQEVAGLRWSELSADLSTWTIPAARTKNNVPHVVPLSQPAGQILRSLPHTGDDLALPGRARGPFNGFSKAKDRLNEAVGFCNWVLHDLRRTLATGLQRLGVRLEVTEAVLNHVGHSRGGIVGIYQRHEW